MTPIDHKSTQSRPGIAVSEGMIPLCVPEIRGNELAYVKECLHANWVSSAGSFVDRFERELAAYIGAEHAVATVNGTAALHIALLVAGIQADDEVLVSTLTFIAPANAVRYVGAWPVFVDAEPDHWQMDPQRVVAFLEDRCHWINGELRNRTTGRRVKGIMPVHILGHPVDMDPIQDVARKYGLVVVEDATESLGAAYKGRMVGTLGDIACFSFNGNKIITTGGGGMIVTDKKGWAEKARYLTTQAKDDPIEYTHSEIGYNYRLTNVQAAIGVAQLQQLKEYIDRKRDISAYYCAALNDVPGIQVYRAADWADSIYWMSTILIDESKFGMSSRNLMSHLSERGIETRPLWRPMSSLPLWEDCQAIGGETAVWLNERALNLPCSVGMNPNELRRVCGTIRMAT